MSNFTIYDETTAPKDSKALLEASKTSFGMIPNLHGVMAESPGLLEAYKVVGELFQKSGFDKNELTVVWQTINVENACHYCVPAHTSIANRMGVNANITDALRNETPLPPALLEALRNFTLSVMRDRGALDAQTVQTFLDAGFTKQNILDVILGYAQKVMSNYTNHFSETYEWHKPLR